MSTPLSTRLREATKVAHETAEQNVFMAELVAGNLPLSGYAALLSQLQYVYAAIDEGAEALRSDPATSAIFDARLDRTAEIVADLATLDCEPMDATPATLAYAARIREVAADWPVGLVAHHYTRYLGDLSGGRVIAKVLADTYGLTPEHGLAFFEFDLPSVPAFKKEYRAHVDALDLDPTEEARFFAEASAAFDYNNALFNSLLPVS